MSDSALYTRGHNVQCLKLSQTVNTFVQCFFAFLDRHLSYRYNCRNYLHFKFHAPSLKFNVVCLFLFEATRYCIGLRIIIHDVFQAWATVNRIQGILCHP